VFWQTRGHGDRNYHLRVQLGIKPKSIALYGVAIASVVILFKVVTSYGEANLQARPNINGKYLMLGTKLPQCFQEKPVVLTIQQSGVYLNANLSNVETKTTSSLKEQLPLKGKWQTENLELLGFIPARQICEKLSPTFSNNQQVLVSIKAKFLNNKSEQSNQINGQVTIDKLGNNLDFTTQPYSTDSKLNPNSH
jgi:hypothetical protein